MKVQIIDRIDGNVLKEYPLLFNPVYPLAGDEIVLNKNTYKIFHTVFDYDLEIIKITVSKYSAWV